MAHEWGVARDKVILTTGTSFFIQLDDGTTLPTEFRRDGKVEVTFPRNDTNFLICIDNSLCSKPIIYDVAINEREWKFIIPAKEKGKHENLETNGRKLHFLSQDTELGREIVTATARKYKTTTEAASISCSEIKITVNYGLVEKSKRVVDFTDGGFTEESYLETDGAERFGSTRTYDKTKARGAVCFGGRSKQTYEEVRTPPIDKRMQISPITFSLVCAECENTPYPKYIPC